jgi:hypothetical protein
MPSVQEKPFEGFGILLNPAIQDFIRAHQDADVAALGLRKPPDPAWPYPLVLDQIKSRQKAKLKIPAWLETENIIFPAPGLLEQASSNATARYKASLVGGKRFADLTAGSGIDFMALLENFEAGIAIERDKNASDILMRNLRILTEKKYEVRNADAESEIKNLPQCDLVYCDPQRRNDRGKGIFRLEDCCPDILSLLPVLHKKTPVIMIKASPMLDIDRAAHDLGSVSHVHVIEWRGECREVVYILGVRDKQEMSIAAVAIDDEGNALKKLFFTRAEEYQAPLQLSEPMKYLFEPSPAFQKAGGFKCMAMHYGVQKLHAHTHLYTSNEPSESFPGRAFFILGLYPASGGRLPVTKANLTVRNFPAETEVLRKKLKLKDGGDDHLFACTLRDERKVLIHCRKV